MSAVVEKLISLVMRHVTKLNNGGLTRNKEIKQRKCLRLCLPCFCFGIFFFRVNTPVHMTAANTQHWPYLTGLKPELAHIFKMSPLPVHALGFTPCLKSDDQFPFSTPRSSSLLIWTRRKRPKSGRFRHQLASRAALLRTSHLIGVFIRFTVCQFKPQQVHVVHVGDSDSVNQLDKKHFLSLCIWE